MPRASIETILSSKPGNRRWYLAISCGSKVDRRSRGTSRSIRPVSVTTVLRPYPLRLLPSSSPPRWWSISAFNARSASAFFSPSSRPFGSKAVFGSAPASSWSRIASGIRGSLRRGMSGLLRSHHARPHTKFPTGPGGAALRLTHVLAGADEQPSDPHRHVTEQGAEPGPVVAFAGQPAPARLAPATALARHGHLRRHDLSLQRRREPLRLGEPQPELGQAGLLVALDAGDLGLGRHARSPLRDQLHPPHQLRHQLTPLP